MSKGVPSDWPPLRRSSRPLLSLRAEVWHLRTRSFARLLGPCFKTGVFALLPQYHPRADPSAFLHVSAQQAKQVNSRHRLSSTPYYALTTQGLRRSHDSTVHESNPMQTPSSPTVSNLLTLFPKFFSSFLCSTCSLSVSHRSLALEGVYLPIWAEIPNNPTHRSTSFNSHASPTGLSPSLARLSRRLRPHDCHGLTPSVYNSTVLMAADLKLGLLPLRSPLLRQSLLFSFPPLSDMLKFSGWSCLTSDTDR